MSLATLKEILTSRAIKMGEPIDWAESIVDLMKLLGMDSREHHIIQLARKLGFTGDMSDKYTMHIWLHKQLIEILIKNAGNLPADFDKP